MSNSENNVRAFRIVNDAQLERAEIDWRDKSGTEAMPFAQNNTPFVEIVRNIVPDKDGPWANPIILIISKHRSNKGQAALCRDAREYLFEQSKENPMDILSITSGMKEDQLSLRILLRTYKDIPDIKGFFDSIGEDVAKKEEAPKSSSGTLIVPDEVKNQVISEKDKQEHDVAYQKQLKVLENASPEKPFLNSLDHYVPKEIPKMEDKLEMIYDLRTKDMQLEIISDYDTFTEIFKEVMTYVNGIEYYHYVNVMIGKEPEKDFMDFLESYVYDAYVTTKKLPVEDLPQLMQKLYRSLFQLYIVQDLIDDPKVTDVKITAPDAIRARVHGKAYMSNITFIDEADYLRFVNGIALRNGIMTNVPSQTFTDDNDENYILRFSLTAEYVNSVPWPYLHIRKVARNKMMAPELIEAGMFDEKIRDYLLDCGKNSRGVVFAGPPGSGKTVALNWFIEEAYEQSVEMLVIQENDELFCYRKGVMFEHVVNYPRNGEVPCSLERLGQLALVAGANVFVIGEVKGAEICSAITLSNSGCRTALTIHSPSSTETLDKMADLALRGYAQDLDQAKRMLKSFQTIVYMENFSVKEISEIIGYDEEKGDMIYRCIYSKDADKKESSKVA